MALTPDKAEIQASNRRLRLARKLLEYNRFRLVKAGQVDTSKTVTAAAPGQGPYYWVLLPDMSWKLKAYVVGREDDIPDHSIYWREVVAPYVAELWGKTRELATIKRYPYGFPRGRVSYFDKIYYLNHGNDAPDPGWEQKVLNEFGLLGWASNRPNQLKTYADGHEKMLTQERSRLMAILDIPAGIVPKSERTKLWA